MLVFLNDIFHIIHARIADFDGVLVEDFVILELSVHWRGRV